MNYDENERRASAAGLKEWVRQYRDAVDRVNRMSETTPKIFVDHGRPFRKMPDGESVRVGKVNEASLMDNRTTNRAVGEDVGEDVDLVQTEDGHHKFVDAPKFDTCFFCGKEIHDTVPREWNAGKVYHVSCWEEVRPIPEPDGRRSVDAPNPMPHPFTVGAQVELKSGGPVMTVEALLNDEIVHLVWFVGGTVVRDTFHFSMLKLAGVQLEKRPVAWRAGTVMFKFEADANKYGEDEGLVVQGLYLRDGT